MAIHLHGREVSTHDFLIDVGARMAQLAEQSSGQERRLQQVASENASAIQALNARLANLEHLDLEFKAADVARQTALAAIEENRFSKRLKRWWKQLSVGFCKEETKNGAE